MIDNEFDELLEEGDSQLEESKRNTFEQIFEFVERDGYEYIFKGTNPLLRLSMVYEMYVFYILQEEYERCRILRNYLFEVGKILGIRST